MTLVWISSCSCDCRIFYSFPGLASVNKTSKNDRSPAAYEAQLQMLPNISCSTNLQNAGLKDTLVPCGNGFTRLVGCMKQNENTCKEVVQLMCRRHNPQAEVP